MWDVIVTKADHKNPQTGDSFIQKETVDTFPTKESAEAAAGVECLAVGERGARSGNGIEGGLRMKLEISKQVVAFTEHPDRRRKDIRLVGVIKSCSQSHAHGTQYCIETPDGVSHWVMAGNVFPVTERLI